MKDTPARGEAEETNAHQKSACDKVQTFSHSVVTRLRLDMLQVFQPRRFTVWGSILWKILVDLTEIVLLKVTRVLWTVPECDQYQVLSSLEKIVVLYSTKKKIISCCSHSGRKKSHPVLGHVAAKCDSTGASGGIHVHTWC
jgi:hypothetical protein